MTDTWRKRVERFLEHHRYEKFYASEIVEKMFIDDFEGFREYFGKEHLNNPEQEKRRKNSLASSKAPSAKVRFGQVISPICAVVLVKFMILVNSTSTSIAEKSSMSIFASP